MLYSVVKILFAAYVCIGIMAYFLAEKIMFQPPQKSYGREPDIMMLNTSDGEQIAIAYLNNPAAAYTILYSHGNAEDLGDIMPWLREVQQKGFSVCSYDYRGYGLSTGQPTVAGSIKDIDTVYQYLVETKGVPKERLILHGYSLGGGVALELAARQQVGGVIVESSFTSAYRTITGVQLFPFDRFNNIDRIAMLNRHIPVLVIHGMDDNVIPFHHGLRLYSLARGAKSYLWVEGAGHNDLREKTGEKYWNALNKMVTEKASAH
jgi:fermentation-respiration switch protein FrsA (DUF1100 family)